MRNMTPYDVVMRIVGPVKPTFDHGVDKDFREPNLKILLDLTEDLIEDIRDVAEFSKRSEASARDLGEMAQKWLRQHT